MYPFRPDDKPVISYESDACPSRRRIRFALGPAGDAEFTSEPSYAAGTLPSVEIINRAGDQALHKKLWI